MMLGLIGKKVGMTQVFTEDGTLVPVTAIEAGPCPIVQVRTEARDGYRAIQIGYGRKKPRRSRKPESGHAALAGLEYVPAVLREFRLGPDDRLAEDPHTPASATTSPEPGEPEAEDAEEGEAESPEAAAPEGADAEGVAETVDGEGDEDGDEGEGQDPQPETAAAETDSAGPTDEGLRVGQVLTVEIFEPGDVVKVSGKTKGRGFQGVMKRHGFGGFPKSHGHPHRRVPGSIGPGTDPSRVIKGRRMAGQMGNERRTIRNLEIVKVDPDRNLIFVKGSVPGARNGLLQIGKQ